MNDVGSAGKACDIGTFIIRVRYRQHSTWQGEIAWAEQERKQYFRSALEMLKMIDGALERTEKGAAEGEFGDAQFAP